MLPTERHARILDAVRLARVVSTEELARQLDVSAETVRRDLVVLESAGRLTRVHGGAVIVGADVTGEETAFSERSVERRPAKEAIGRAAAGLVRPGQTIVIDVGTTALEVARALPGTFRGVVATCSLLVAAELAGRTGVELLVSGGRVRAGDLACSNHQAQAFFADLHADLAFLGSGGVDVEDGLSDYHLDEVATRRVMIANTTRSFALADTSKIGRTAPHRVCALADLAGVVAEKALPAAVRKAVERGGGTVVTP